MLTKLRFACALALCCLSILALASCGGAEPEAAAASPEPTAAPASAAPVVTTGSSGYLLSIHDLQLEPGLAASVDFNLAGGGAVEFWGTTQEPLASYRLFAVSAPPVSKPLGRKDVPLKGNGKTGGGVTAYLLGAADLPSSWYRFELTGDGRLLWLAVVRP